MNQETLAYDRAQDVITRAGYTIRQLQPAGTGSQHHLFVVELDDGPMRLLRLPRTELAARLGPVLQAEAEAVLRSSRLLPTAHPIELLPTINAPEASLEPILPGTRASDLRAADGGGGDLTRICIELGRVLAQLHAIRKSQDTLTMIRTVEADDADEEPCLLHGDAHLGNLLVEADAERGWRITGVIDWSFCAWGPPEADLVEMAICEAEPRPHLGRVFYESYVDAGGLPPRESVFHELLERELQRRLSEHRQAQDMGARDTWTRWLDALQRPAASATRVFAVGREPGKQLT